MPKPIVFISHINQERDIACTVKSFLEEQFLGTIDVFASSHEDSLQMGEDWMGTIKKSIVNAEIIIIICSPISVMRPRVNFEAGAGWVRGIPVIPLCHSGIQPGDLPVPINSFQGGLLNSKEDIRRVFNRIAKLLNMNPPLSDSSEFYQKITSFEKVIVKSAISKDAIFVRNLLSRQIEILKYSIYASTRDYKEQEEIYLAGNLSQHSFTFNDTYCLFNFSTLMIYTLSKIYEVFYKNVHELAKNARFLLSYNNIEITPEMKELLNVFIFSVVKADDWFDGISLIDKKTNSDIREMSINMIKKEPLPPEKKNSNTINYFIDYYDSLVYFKDWIVNYEAVLRSTISEVPPNELTMP
ncbi:toll/interleukin-1 receptor domain-containing protein [Myxococcota bacterium]|nr:toll/interleukin-1 receptor domain-containing protein [Myxococcota bacterium]MBU1381377.1 toll/interleukin-1 receptor domain-containing protein [Myxococcota bacterium]MBU1498380.1 toll/interleukin-1 receptor domain-containing protein [Myxococcota bacterium]